MQCHFEYTDEYDWTREMEVLTEVGDYCTVQFKMKAADYDDYEPEVHLSAGDVKDLVNMLQDWLQEQEEA